MGLLATHTIHPPLINSANPWATTVEDLRDLYSCPSLGAITIRTSLLEGYPHNESIHQYTFFSPTTGSSASRVSSDGRGKVINGEESSLNTLGYSPTSFQAYLDIIEDAVKGYTPGFRPTTKKPIIVSVTGNADEVCECYKLLSSLQFSHYESLRLMMEINLSCPNIVDKPPPAYDGKSLSVYLSKLSQVREVFDYNNSRGTIPVGIKTPPYTYQGQYNTLIHTLKTSANSSSVLPIEFITSCNTLGSCLVLNNQTSNPALNSATGEGIGGMAGSALHPLALGNVATIRKMLNDSGHAKLQQIFVIGVGGVSDSAGFERMRSVGADIVGVGTALGREGVSVFEKILRGSISV